MPVWSGAPGTMAVAAPDKLVFLEGGTLYLTLGVPEPARATRLQRVAFAPHFYHNAVHDGGAYDRDAMFALVDDALSAFRRAAETTAQALARNPGEGYDADAQINSTIYLIDPTRFAVESYRHFLRPENGMRFLHEVLAGRIRLA